MPFHNKHSYLHAPRRTRSRPFDNAVAGRRDSRHDEDGLIALNAYQLLEDAWSDGVAQWCRSASAFVLGGGRAWMVTASEGQGNWIRSRLLCEGVSLFGVQFLDARSLRRELCLHLGTPPPVLGGDTLEFLLRLYALRGKGQGLELSSVARHPGACLAALGDLAATGWLDDSGVPGDVLSSSLNQWLPELRATGAWTPEVDRRLLARAAAAPANLTPLAVCVFGWDASFWPSFDLLLATMKTAASARVYTPSPRGTSESIQQSWQDALEGATGEDFAVCESSDFPSSLADLVGRLDGADMDSTASHRESAEPELLVGVDSSDLAVLARDFVARWIAATPPGLRNHRVGGADRLVILCPCRNASAVGVVRALTDAGIAVEDELGEIPEPSLSIQIQRAILDYHQEGSGLESLLALIELLNDHAALRDDRQGVTLQRVFPLDPVEARQALHDAFADVQHHSARVLSGAAGFLRAGIARPLRELIAHLGEWPEALDWTDALRRWEDCLNGFGLTTEVLEPLWSRLAELSIDAPVPSAAFFQYLGRVLACGVPAQRPAGAAHRFARVVITTLEGAIGQTWGGLLFLDSNEGAWPIYPPENPFLDDAARHRLNEQRAASDAGPPERRRHHLLTSSDHAQLEHFRFLDVLENCTGPLAFAGVSRDPSEFTRELYPNEWALRCLIEGSAAANGSENLLDRWRRATRRAERRLPRLGKRDAAHLGEVFAGRRDPGTPFDQYLFNFDALTAPDELPFTAHWSARDLQSAWNRPATFALAEIFGVEPWRDGARELVRGESWMIGRLVHRWLHSALRGPAEPRRLSDLDWQHALTSGLARARAETETRLRAAAAPGSKSTARPDGDAGLPLWWQGVLHKADWAARRCLETLAQAARGGTDPGGNEHGPRWFCLDKTFRAELSTPAGRLRLRGHCDVMLLDRPELTGAVCQLIDIRTGAVPAAVSSTAAQVESGRGIGEAAMLLLAREEGAVMEGSQARAVHPEAAMVTLLSADGAPALLPAFERLAARQRSLCFGQRGAVVESGHGRHNAENLPLATTPVDPVILEAKSLNGHV